MSHDSLFEKFTGDPDNPDGVFAYLIYKQQKQDYCKSFGGRDLTREELDRFDAFAALETSITAYIVQGRASAQVYINASLEDLVERTKVSTRQETLHRHMEAVNAGLSGKLTAINETLGAKRTLLGWARDITGNLLINLVSIFVIGALLLGYKFSGELQQGAEQKTGIKATTEPDNSIGKPAATVPALPR